jgi:hypothetical protein
MSLVAGTFLAAGTALAVHDADVFELDANAVDDAAVAGIDWDVIFAQANTAPDGCAGTIACSFTHELDNETIFTGGRSKDDLDTSGWKHKAGSVPPKDDLADGFAARFTVAGYDPDGALGPLLPPSDIIYFGADRTSNDGDAFMGFWFFQADITALSGGTFGPGVHVDGDILVITDFSGGGGTVSLAVYQWNGPGGAIAGSGAINGTLDELVPFGSADCATVGDNDPACATVNDGTITVPWTFLDKGGSTGPRTGEFVEGGINLTFLGLDDECFSSFLAETRSSTSVNATLKDFIGGQFDVCNAALTTQVSSSSVTPGTAVTDTATVTGSSPSKNPSGTVTFFLCSFAAGTTTACDGTTGNEGTPLTNVPPQGNLTGSGGVSTAVSPEVNTAGNALLPGRYCFRAEWPGDSNYVGALKEFSIATECFTVAKLTPTVTTTSSSTGNVNPGTSVTDTANVSGSGPTPTGDVDFILCQPSEVTAAGCPSPAGTKIGATKQLSGGSATSDATTNTTTLGKYCWRAEYKGDSVYDASSHTNAGTECFTVTTSASGTSAQRWLPNDRIVVTSASGNLAGTLSITLRSATCTGTVVYTEPVPDSGAFTATAAGAVYNTTNSTVFVGTNADNTAGLAAGTYYWSITFTPTSTFATGFTKCETSTLTINNNP